VAGKSLHPNAQAGRLAVADSCNKASATDPFEFSDLVSLWEHEGQGNWRLMFVKIEKWTDERDRKAGIRMPVNGRKLVVAGLEPR
jgi:hypothetical protein